MSTRDGHRSPNKIKGLLVDIRDLLGGWAGLIARRVGFHPTDESRSDAAFSGVMVGRNPTLRLVGSNVDRACQVSGGVGAQRMSVLRLLGIDSRSVSRQFHDCRDRGVIET